MKHNDKKHLLFITYAMPIGGIETALLSLLEQIDKEAYDISLLLVEKEGENLIEIPDGCHVLEFDERDKIFLLPASRAVSELKKRHYVWLNLIRIGIAVRRRIVKKFGMQYDSWKRQRRYVSENAEHYDVAIDYSGTFFCYIIDKVSADRKLSWNHFDYKFFDSDAKENEKYYKKLDYFVSVSTEGADTLRKYFPSLTNIRCMYNILNEKMIRRKVEETIDDEAFPLEKDGRLFICSIGRLFPQKNFLLAVRAADVLKKRGICFFWYIIGDGRDRAELEKEIQERNLQDDIVLLGKKKNPYKYLNMADIYVQTSEFEGRCIAVTEAQALYKPVVVTNVQGLRESVENGRTGFLADLLPESLADAIEQMNLETRRAMEKELSMCDNKEKNHQMELFYALIEGRA